MRILLISNGFQPNYEKAFANGLAAAGVAVTLVSSDRTLVSELHPSIRALNLRGSQDPSRTVLTKALNIVRYGVRIFGLVRSPEYDVVHLVGSFMTRSVSLGFAEWLMYRWLTRHFFMTVHNVMPHGDKRRRSWLLHYAIYRLPTMLVAHSAAVKARLASEFGIRPEKIVVMPHGIDAVPETRQEPSPSNALRMLVFGSLNRYKGTDLLLSSLRFCRHIPLDIRIVGEVRDRLYATEIQKLIESVEPPHSVSWRREFIREEAVQECFESVDVSVLPYRCIDQSGVLFTSLRFGVPVIATDVGTLRDSMPDDAGVICSEPTPESIAKAIDTFYARRTSYDRRRIRGFARTRAWSVTVLSLVDAYRSVLH